MSNQPTIAERATGTVTQPQSYHPTGRQLRRCLFSCFDSIQDILTVLQCHTVHLIMQQVEWNTASLFII